MSTRKQRAYLAAIGMGVAALAVDKLVLEHPAAAPAEAAANVDAAGPRRPVHAATIVAGGEIPELPFPRNLPAYDGSTLARDPFLPSGLAADPGGELPSDNGQPADPKTERLGRVAFSLRYRLNGVLVHQSLRIAIVEGRWLRIGETLSGCRLVLIGENEARFECFDGEAVLTVINPGRLPGGG
jgi:hypothetical protein